MTTLIMINSTEVMKRANAAFEKTGMTLEELGKKMGADPDTARMTAWQFLRKSTDPRMSMILRFCEAVEISVGELCGEKASRK